MRTRSELLAALLSYSLFLVAPIADAYAEAGHSVAVMNLRSHELPKRILRILEELLAVAVTENSAFAVITLDDISAQLGLEDMKDVLGCEDVDCAAEIGGALGTRYLLTGSARRLGRKLYVTLTFIDTQQQLAIGRSRAKVQNDEDLYEDAINTAVKNLIRSLPSNVLPRKRSDGALKVSDAETPPAIDSKTQFQGPTTPPVADETQKPAGTGATERAPNTRSPTAESSAARAKVSAKQERLAVPSSRDGSSRSRASSASRPFTDTNGAESPAADSVERELHTVMRDGAKEVADLENRRNAEDVTQKTTPEARDDGGVAGPLATTLFAVAVGTGIVAGYFEYKAWTYNKNATDDTYDGRQVAAVEARKNQSVARILGSAGLLIATAGSVSWWLGSGDFTATVAVIASTSDVAAFVFWEF